MTRLVLRSAAFFWRTNLAVACGVAAAVAVLGGALLVGDSVRGSLREIALSRLGRTGFVISSPAYLREDLAARLQSAAPAAPLISTSAAVTHEPSSRRASGVLVYGVDDRFWAFHGLAPREGVLVSPALQQELNVAAGDVLLTRLQRPSDIPLESLFSQKDELSRTVRLSAAGVLPRQELGEFSTQPQQAEVRALFVPLARLQRDLGVREQVNTVLVAADAAEPELSAALGRAITLEDLGVAVAASPDGRTVRVESAGGVISGPLESSVREAAATLGLRVLPIFTYLANTIRVGERRVPYSLITGIDLRLLADGSGGDGGSVLRPRADVPPLGAPLPGPASLVLNAWAARELGASIGDAAEVEYYLWDPSGGLRTERTAFTVTGVVPMEGMAADRTLAPEYPGITEAESLADWEPPFPVDLSRVRPQDEQYWRDHRATPKAFVDYDRARALWATRYGNATGVRLEVPPGADAAALAQRLRDTLRQTLKPSDQGVLIVPARQLALSASAGATNFAEYFTYFSFFIVFSALLLTVLFFRLGVEQRLRQVGLLRATGYTPAAIRRLLLSEAALIALAGSVAGVAGAVAYAHVIVYGLRTWWVGAVGTTLLTVHVSPLSLAAGAAGGMLAALACVLVSLRRVASRTPRALLAAYSLDEDSDFRPARARARARLGTVCVVGALSFLTLGAVAPRVQAGSFFGAGALLLAGCLLYLAAWLRTRDRSLVRGTGRAALWRLGFRGTAARPGRTVLSVALIAAAAFIIVSVDAFRRGGADLSRDPRSGTGGYALLARAEVPLVHDPGDARGREALMATAPELAGITVARFRLRPGDDASCLNLYRPTNPAIVAPEDAFLEQGRFSFSASLAATPEEQANPWRLLRRPAEDGIVPVIADGTSLQYVLHAAVGDTMTIDTGGSTPLTVRFVGALRDSVLQGELVMGQEHFLRLFPGFEGFRYFLIDAPDVSSPGDARALAEVIEREFQPFGVDAISTAERLDAFHRVENTYLSTFQALGTLGLLLGTVGVGTVMFRNVLERRRELALLRAVGYDRRHLGQLILAETLFLLVSGLTVGAGAAAVAVLPAWMARGGVPGVALLLLLAMVGLVSVVAAALATRAATRGELLQALRAE